MLRIVPFAVAVLAAACSPAAQPEEAAQGGAPVVAAVPGPAASVTTPGEAPPATAAASTVPVTIQDPAPRPQGIPADPDRPVGPGVAEAPKGGLTLAAFQDSMVERVLRLDTDGDGALNRAEVDAAGQSGRMLAAADSNRDGRVTQAEVRAGAAFMFSRMDQNDDGRVTEDERPQQ